MMEIDGYNSCPCHVEKKIRFCCGKDIIGDLNLILGKVKGNQLLAALDDTERAIKKHGPKDCLLTLKAQLLNAHGEPEKAEQVNHELIEKTSNEHVGYSQLAFLRLSNRDVAGAVDALQDSMERITGDEIPVSLSDLFRAVGIGLMQQGQLVASRTHLRFASYLKNDKDPELRALYQQSFGFEGIPLVLRTEFSLQPISEAEKEEEWGRKYHTVQRATARGQYRKSLKYLRKVDEAFPNKKQILHAICVLNMSLGYEDEIRNSWLRYSELEALSDIQRIEAVQIADYFFDGGQDGPKVSNAIVTMEISDFSAALEQALSMGQLRSAGNEFRSADDAPPPRNVFVLLDKPLSSVADLTLENASEMIGSLLFFGKQTDRNARLEWHYDKVPHRVDLLESIMGHFKQWQIGELKEVVESDELLLQDVALETRWMLPDDLPMERRIEVLSDLVSKNLIKNWAHVPMQILEGKTPMEAAGIPRLRNHLQSQLLFLEETALRKMINQKKGNPLREYLGVPEPSPAALEGRSIGDLTSLEISFLDVDSLSNEDLKGAYLASLAVKSTNTLQKIILRLLETPLEGGITRQDLYVQLGMLAEDTENGLQYLSLARQEAQKANAPLGHFLVTEFEYRLARGVTDKLSDLMEVIKRFHIQDPEIRNRMATILNRYGLLSQGPVDGEADDSASVPPIGPVSSRSENQTSSGLWIPD